MPQGLDSQNDLPQARGAYAFAQRWLCRVSNGVWYHLLQRSLFCLIDERAVGAGDHKVDFDLAEITHYSLQNFLCFRSLPVTAAWMSAFDRNRPFSCLRCATAWQAREHDCSCASHKSQSISSVPTTRQ